MSVEGEPPGNGNPLLGQFRQRRRDVPVRAESAHNQDVVSPDTAVEVVHHGELPGLSVKSDLALPAGPYLEPAFHPFGAVGGEGEIEHVHS
ncbi:hypothetical protein ACFLSJ_07330 [Verrucomicrobiota bacterium]